MPRVDRIEKLLPSGGELRKPECGGMLGMHIDLPARETITGVGRWADECGMMERTNWPAGMAADLPRASAGERAGEERAQQEIGFQAAKGQGCIPPGQRHDALAAANSFVDLATVPPSALH